MSQPLQQLAVVDSQWQGLWHTVVAFIQSHIHVNEFTVAGDHDTQWQLLYSHIYMSMNSQWQGTMTHSGSFYTVTYTCQWIHSGRGPWHTVAAFIQSHIHVNEFTVAGDHDTQWQLLYSHICMPVNLLLMSSGISTLLIIGTRCSSMVRAFAHGAMGHRIDPSWGGPIELFLVPTVLHDWCNKGRGMYYPVCGMMHIKEPLLLIGKHSLCGSSRFPLSYLSGPLPYVWHHITVNKMCWVHH